MSITVSAWSGVGSGSSSASAGTVAIDTIGKPYTMYAFVHWGNSTNAPPITPSGWTHVYTGISVNDNGGVYGVDTGPRGITIFKNERPAVQAATVEPALAMTSGGTGTTRVLSVGQVAFYGDAPIYESIVGIENITGTMPYSVTIPASDFAFSTDGVSQYSFVVATSAIPRATNSGTFKLNAAGVWNNLTIAANYASANANGNDVRGMNHDAAATAFPQGDITAYYNNLAGTLRGITALMVVTDAPVFPGSLTDDVIVGGVKKAKASEVVVVNGQKKTIVNRWVVKNGQKKTIT